MDPLVLYQMGDLLTADPLASYQMTHVLTVDPLATVPSFRIELWTRRSYPIKIRTEALLVVLFLSNSHIPHLFPFKRKVLGQRIIFLAKTCFSSRIKLMFRHFGANSRRPKINERSWDNKTVKSL